MKILIFIVLLASSIFSESYNMQLLSFLPYEQESSDITGFYQDGREFAVIGLQNAASFVDITDPYNPFELGRIDGSNSIWRDLKYWDRHVYIGTEADDGIKIVSVDNPDNPILVNTITDVDNSHNIHVDHDGYLYIVGADEHDVWIYSLENPSNPNLVGTWDQEYCHDIEVFNNKLYCAAIYTGNFYIVDVQDKSNPQTLVSHFTGIDGISTHDVAVTEDEQYLFTGDENLGGHIKVWDISDYDNIDLVDEYQSPEGQEHTSHNLYVRPGTNYLIISYYADGTRVVDISDPANLQEIAYYDMSDVEGLYVSNWGTYAYLPSGNIISSDIEQGLFVLQMGGVSILHDPIEDIDIEEQGTSVNFIATVETFDGSIEDVYLNYSYNGEDWNVISMENVVSTNFYETVFVPDQEGILLYYYITANNNQNQSSVYPENGNIMFVYGNLTDIVFENFETESNGWTVESDATSGIWELVEPTPTYDNGVLAQPDFDVTEDGEKCFVTGNDENNNSGQDDVDSGTTTLYSPLYNLSVYENILLTYWRWYTNNLGNNPGTDIWNVQVTNDGSNWVNIEYTNSSDPSWKEKRFVLNDYIDLTTTVQFRYIASDLYNNGDNGSGGSLVEAALDDFLLEAISFESFLGDLNFDYSVDVLDVVVLINIILDDTLPSDDQYQAADINNDLFLDVLDVVLLVNLILE